MIINLSLFFCLIFLQQGLIPQKPADEYEVIVDYKFQERPPADRYKANYDVGADEQKKSGGPLPYLKLQIKLLKLNSEEVKVKVVNNNGNLVFSRKTSLDTPIKLDIGFIDDVKDRIIPHEFTVMFYTDSKSPVSQIRLVVSEDGTFFVNDEKKGKF